MNMKSLKTQFFAAIAMVLVAAIAMGGATYAWFVNNANVTATGAEVTASTAYSLLISKASAIDGDWQTTKALNGNSGLTPVSTIGTRLAADKADMYNYNATAADKAAGKGDVRFVTSSAWANEKVINYNEVGKNSKTAADTKYYYTDTVYLKAAQASSIALDSSTTGIVWNKWDDSANAREATGTFYTFDDFVALTETGTAAGFAAYQELLLKAQALVKTLRVGFQVTKITATPGTVDADATIATNRANTTNSKFFVYQLIGTNFTVYKSSTAQGDANGVTAAIGPTDTNADTIVASGATPNLNTANNNAIAFDSGASVPVIGTKMVAGSATGIATIGTADALASVVANDVTQVDIYIWMEGCDFDVIAANLDEFNAANIPGIQFGFCLAQ